MSRAGPKAAPLVHMFSNRAADRKFRASILARPPEHIRQPICHDMDDLAFGAEPGHGPPACRTERSDATLPLIDDGQRWIGECRSRSSIGNEHDALGRARPLSQEDKAGDLHPAPVPRPAWLRRR